MNYNKINSLVTYIGNNTGLFMNVILSNTDDKTRFRNLSFHFETEYHSNKINDTMTNIKLSYRYYLSIENLKANENGIKEFIMITPSDMYELRRGLMYFYKNVVCKQDEIFIKRDERYYINKQIKPITMDGFPMGKFIILEPITTTTKDDVSYPATKIYLSSNDVYTVIGKRAYEGLLYTIMHFNMYQSAQELINYFGKPSEGTNHFIVKKN